MGFLREFKSFAMRGNLIGLAVGFTVGAAFSTVAKSLVDDIIMPPIGLLVGQQAFTDLFVVLKSGTETPGPYETLAEAQAAGAVTLNYGQFINNVVAFLLVALAMFLLIRVINRIDRQLEEELAPRAKDAPALPENKKCPYCLSTISYKAVRCPHCTSELEPAPEPAAP